MKRCFLVIIVFVCSIHLASCGTMSDKNTAYCFSAVFERDSDGALITLYCKTANEDKEEKSEKDEVITLYSDSFNNAFLFDSESEYEIYYNSLKSFYIDESVSNEDLLSICRVLYNKTKYQTSHYVYIGNSKDDKSLIHERAKKVCTSKKISANEKDMYINLTKYMRDNLN